MVSDRRSLLPYSKVMDETKIEKLARLSGRVASKVAGALADTDAALDHRPPQLDPDQWRHLVV
jgi:hypothetical protein